MSASITQQKVLSREKAGRSSQTILIHGIHSMASCSFVCFFGGTKNVNYRLREAIELRSKTTTRREFRLLDFLSEMEKCKTINECIELALVDAYDEYEELGSWLICIEDMFGHHKKAKVLGLSVTIVKFDIYAKGVIAVCKNGKNEARVSLDSIEFSKSSKHEKLWLKAWKKYSA